MCPDTSFSDLKSLSVKLNVASDKLNKIIESAEHELNALNLGIEAWSTMVLAHGDSQRVGTERLHDVSYFGWSKFKGKWQMVVKTECERHGFFQGDMDSPYAGVDSVTYYPLKEAPRELRARAISCFADLKEELRKEMEKVIAVVEQKNNGSVF